MKFKVLLMVMGLVPITLAGGTSTFAHETSGIRVETTSEPFDLQFVEKVSEHHKDGIRLAELAIEKTDNPEIKRIAENMIRDQRDGRERLDSFRYRWFRQSGGPKDRLPKIDIGELKKARDDDFDQAFLESISKHHQEAIKMAIEGVQKSDHREVKGYAQKLLSDRQRELVEIKEIKRSSVSGTSTSK